MVAEAASGKSKHQKMRAQAKATAQKKTDRIGSPPILTPPDENKIA
jgi:hypothetical protein